MRTKDKSQTACSNYQSKLHKIQKKLKMVRDGEAKGPHMNLRSNDINLSA